MTVSRLYMPAVTLAGALALAGCGGGSNTTTDNSGNMCPAGETGTPPNCMKPAEDEKKENETKSLDLPNGLTLDGPEGHNGPRDYTIQPGKMLDLATNQTGRMARFSCPAGGEACVITVPVDGNASAVTYSGGTPVVTEAKDPAVTVNTGVTQQPTESTDPLSNDVLLKALKTGTRAAADDTVWNVDNNSVIAADPAAVDLDKKIFKPLSGPTVNLRVDRAGGARGNEAYFGDWYKFTVATGQTEENISARGVVWGGNKPYGRKPDTGITKAIYSGGATDVVDALLYHSTDGKKWTRGTGDLSLEANFKTGKVGGTVAPGAIGSITLADTAITLSETDIGSDGTFSGTAKFSAPSITRQSGSWKGGFFGDTTEVVAGVQKHKAPDHVAGEFRVSRQKIGTAQAELHVRGAFGNDKDPDP